MAALIYTRPTAGFLPTKHWAEGESVAKATFCLLGMFGAGTPGEVAQSVLWLCAGEVHFSLLHSQFFKSSPGQRVVVGSWLSLHPVLHTVNNLHATIQVKPEISFWTGTKVVILHNFGFWQLKPMH